MWPYIKAIFTDEGKFLGFARAILMVGGVAVEQAGGAIPWMPPLAGYGLIAASMMMRSSAGKKADS